MLSVHESEIALTVVTTHGQLGSPARGGELPVGWGAELPHTILASSQGEGDK